MHTSTVRDADPASLQTEVAMLPAIEIACPYCGEWIELSVDASAGDQQYIEDCQVCCRPIQLSVTLDEAGEPEVVARAENDT